MAKWQHSDAHYFTVKRASGKWSVLEVNPDKTREYIGEFENRKEASDMAYELEQQGNALRYAEIERRDEPSIIKIDKEKKESEHTARLRRVDENIESERRIAQRRQEYENYKTKHQQKRNERSP